MYKVLSKTRRIYAQEKNLYIALVNEYPKDTSSKPPMMKRDIQSITMDRDGIMYNIGELERLCISCASRLNDILGPLSR